MSRASWDRLLALWCAVTAGGFTLYWVTWFSAEHTEPWLPPGYVEHERAFVFTDAPLTILLVVIALLLVRGRPEARSVALFAAGMLAFLGVVDLGYFAMTGMFDPAHDGLVNAVIVGGVLALAVGLAGHAVVSAQAKHP